MDKFVRTSFETIADFELDLKLFLSEQKPNGFNCFFNESDLGKESQLKLTTLLKTSRWYQLKTVFKVLNKESRNSQKTLA